MRYLKTAGNVLLWIVQVLAAVGFVAIGTGKFGDPNWARRFAGWGYPDGFYMLIGVLEAAGGVLLLVPKLSSYAAAMLGVIMIGAAATHLLHGETARIVAPLPWLGVMILIALARRGRAWRPRRISPVRLEHV